MPSTLNNSYDCILDGGTIEHVFNAPIAFASVMQMIRPGGLFIATTMANNYCGHGFYQFSPELFYRMFSEVNGFQIQMCQFYDGRLVDAPDPGPAGGSGQLPASPIPLMLMVAARKVRDCTPFTRGWPVQGQYISQWQTS